MAANFGEAPYALIAYQHGSEGGVAGFEWAQKVLDQKRNGVIEFAQAAELGGENYYLKCSHYVLLTIYCVACC